MGDQNIYSQLAELEFLDFRVTVESRQGVYSAGLGRQHIRVNIRNDEGLFISTEVMLPKGAESVDNFLKRLASSLDRPSQEQSAEQTPHDLKERIEQIVGATWKDWKQQQDEAKKRTPRSPVSAA